MGSASISGLASGLDTATSITQLMQLEAIPQARLKSRATKEQSQLSVLQQLNSRLAALATSAAKDVSPTTGAWASLTVTSSNAGVTAAATVSAQPATYTVTVGATALAHQLAFTDAHPLTAVVTPVGTDVLLKRAGEPDLVISTADGTLEQVAAAINAVDAGVHASLVKVGTTDGTDQYRLLVQATATGAAGSFELTAADGSALLGGATVRAGRDAQISIGGIDAYSASNTFTDVVPGLTLTLTPDATGTAEITVSLDGASRTAAVKSLVTDINAILDRIKTSTAHDSDPAKAGILSGDRTLRRVSDALLGAIYPPDGTSLASYGLELDRFGKLTFDEEAFAAAYAADPDAVTAAFTGADGFAARVQQAAEAASDRFDGYVTAAATSRTASIERLTDDIGAWDDRLALRRASLERQYTALETALSRMQGQSSWLAGQLSSLSANQE